MKRAFSSLFSFLVIAGTFAACEMEQPKLPAGRCNVNSDCLEGEACRKTFCEDIYFPRKDIKPY